MENWLATKEDKVEILKKYGLDEDGLKRDVGILKVWLKKQPHLPQGVQDDDFLETILIANKCRIEKTKECIDSYYAVKTVWPELFYNLKNVVPSRSSVHIIPLQDLTPTKERVLIFRVNDDPSSIQMTDGGELALALREIIFCIDYGYRVLIDCSNITLHHLTRLTPSLFYKYQSVVLNAYAARLVGFECYKPGPWFPMLLSLLKPIVPVKLLKRIRHHDSTMSLKTAIPQHILPKEYDGDGKSLNKLLEEMDQVFDQYRHKLSDVLLYASDESRRVGKCKYESAYFGVDGTFKQIAID